MNRLFAVVAFLPFIAFAAPPADSPSVHGMLIFGKSNTYVSHLPMFHAPHDYQVILEVELDAAAKAAFAKARQAAAQEKVWTFVPERFSLPTKVAAGQGFKGDIYEGHFERGGTKVVSAAPLTVTSVVHFRKFDPSARADKNATFVFGKKGELYSAHLIGAAPDFDRIAAVEIQPDGKVQEREVLYHETEDLK